MGRKKQTYSRIIIRNYTGEIPVCKFLCEAIRRLCEDKRLKGNESCK